MLDVCSPAILVASDQKVPVALLAESAPSFRAVMPSCSDTVVLGHVPASRPDRVRADRNSATPPVVWRAIALALLPG
jgi:hypothetical protein